MQVGSVARCPQRRRTRQKNRIPTERVLESVLIQHWGRLTTGRPRRSREPAASAHGVRDRRITRSDYRKVLSSLQTGTET